MYELVLPRDLFNQSKLLQQLGKLCLAIHDRKVQGISFWYNDGDNFDICLSDAGYLYCDNLLFTLTSNDKPIELYTSYNSRIPNPLLFADPSNGEEMFVFMDDEEDGLFTNEFVDMINNNS
jgi:hypothetical protein